MIAKLFAAISIVSIVELSLLLALGAWVHWGATLGLVAVTAAAGALLLKREGRAAWRAVRSDLGSGRALLDGGALLDGAAVTIAAAFLLTPGVLTDLAAFALLLPTTRRPIKELARKRVTKLLADQALGASFEPGAAPPERLGPRADDVVVESGP